MRFEAARSAVRFALASSALVIVLCRLQWGRRRDRLAGPQPAGGLRTVGHSVQRSVP